MARRTSNDVKRSIKEKLQPYARVLIVSEGQTEKCYFDTIRKKYRMSKTNINIIALGADPKSIVKHAKEKTNEAKNDNAPYKHVFCVFDRNGHTTFNSASQTIQNDNCLTSARSWPCFEYWVLLHFDYNSRKSFIKTGTKSSCDTCTDELKKHIPNYEKNNESNFKELMGKLETAIKNGKKSRRDVKIDRVDNPSTEVHKVVECLMNIRP